MVNKKPVMTIIIRDDEVLSLNDFCTVITTAIIKFIDEVDYGFPQAKHEIALRNWDFTGQRINVRQATDEQWWNFLLEDGYSGSIDHIRYHVIPPTDPNLLSENVRYCQDASFNIVEEFKVQPREREIAFPLLSILIEKKEKFRISEYLEQAKDVAITNMLLTKNNMEYEKWARNDFALSVSIVDNMHYLIPPSVTLEKRRGHINALGLWIDE